MVGAREDRPQRGERAHDGEGTITSQLCSPASLGRAAMHEVGQLRGSGWVRICERAENVA